MKRDGEQPLRQLLAALLTLRAKCSPTFKRLESVSTTGSVQLGLSPPVYLFLERDPLEHGNLSTCYSQSKQKTVDNCLLNPLQGICALRLKRASGEIKRDQSFLHSKESRHPHQVTVSEQHDRCSAERSKRTQLIGKACCARLCWMPLSNWRLFAESRCLSSCQRSTHSQPRRGSCFPNCAKKPLFCLHSLGIP